jgi:hypothetical protein
MLSSISFLKALKARSSQCFAQVICLHCTLYMVVVVVVVLIGVHSQYDKNQ